jgi:hypothetical protein
MGQYDQDEFAYNILLETKGNTSLSIQVQFKRVQKEGAEKLKMQLFTGISFHPPAMFNN